MIVLLATTFDCNNHILLLAWGVVGVENKENWTWFMSHLDDSFPRMREEKFTVIVSDRDKGLKEGVSQVWPHMYHSFCTRHIRANVITKSDLTIGNFFFDEVNIFELLYICTSAIFYIFRFQSFYLFIN
jgi:transposase-like protein